MTSESTIAIQIRTALAQHLKRDVSRINPKDSLREDLGLDSLAMIELLFKIEEHFDLEIPNEDLSRVTTVADVTAYVEEKLGAKAAPAATAKAVPALGEVKPQASRVHPEVGPSGAREPAPVRSAGDGVTAKPAPPARLPAKVTSIKAAAKRKAAQASPKAAAKKKGSRRA
jgi:acyl carrier protein